MTVQKLKLKAARVQAGYTQKQVEGILGVAHNRLSQWESGQVIPRLNNFMALCKLYNVEPDELDLSIYGVEE